MCIKKTKKLKLFAKMLMTSSASKNGKTLTGYAGFAKRSCRRTVWLDKKFKCLLNRNGKIVKSF